MGYIWRVKQSIVYSRKEYLRIVRLAFPIILANASVPLLGLADTAAIGQTGAAAELGAIALATLVFNFVYWGFGFLRMGTTGFIAQAWGARDQKEVHATLFRSILLGFTIGVLLIVFQKVIGNAALALLNSSDQVKDLVRDYFFIRIWSAPATLITFALLGALIGLGWTKRLLWVQLFLNGLNIVLNLLFVLGLGWGVKGIAAGTLVAEWASVLVALWMVFSNLGIRKPFARMRELSIEIFNKVRLTGLMSANADIMIRTFALLAAFYWFANQGASFGDATLAANHILLQFVSFSAFFLDGFAHVSEMLSGQAYGARDRRLMLRNIAQSTHLAALSAICLAGICFFAGSFLIALLAKDPQVQEIAAMYVPFAAIYILVSFMAFQLDGIFIGMTKTKEMRNSTLISLVGFVGISIILQSYWDNQGLWIAFITYVLLRALSLGAYFIKIVRG